MESFPGAITESCFKYRGFFAAVQILTISLLLIFLSSCGFNKQYSYENIRKQYPSREYITGQSEESKGKVPGVSGIDGDLTLSDAIDIAVQNNPDMERAAWKIEQSRSMLLLAKSAFWPRASVYTEYMQGDAPSAYLFKKIDQRQLPQILNFNDPGWFENFESGIEAKMNLFNGGKDYLKKKMAEKDLAASRFEREKIENELTARVIKTFYDALAAREFISIAEQSKDSVAEQLRLARLRHESGSALKAEVMSLKVRLARARDQVIKSKNRYKLTLAGLANLMGLEPTELTDQKTGLKSGENNIYEIPPDYKTAVVKAIDNRPELARTRQQVVKSRMGLDAAKSTYLPSLDLSGRYYFDDSGLDYDRDRENWTAALMLRWNLFTGFSRPAMVSRADARVREMMAADRQAAQDIKLDVKNAYLALEEARSRYRVAESSVEAALESYRLVKRQYEKGAASITRYLEAELDRNRARVQAVSARYDRIRAMAEVSRAIGSLGGKNR
ncbi:MAG: TolC family protein [Desulfobacterales bacterium]